ncbi:MAG: hypothetical protein K6C97_03385 [Treponema sp.]|nr:hypothetical protein [Treponema sp.]
MKKTFIVLTLLSIFFSRLSAASGPLSGEKDLRIVKTQWFDIIYPERCNNSAKLLYENADQLYQKVTEQYGLSPAFRMPVVICPAVDSFNAFWSIAPYNHIVIYDTSVIDLDELNVFTENLLSTFEHELTHAVTFNMKNKFWTGVSSVFGDVAVPGLLMINTGMAEGAAVTSESSRGEGRLNDEYAKHFVKQAKIEGQFPSFYDVMGAADNSPSGAPYYFNAAFHQWLQDNYGLEAYAKFWYLVVNLHHLTLNASFKEAFGLPIKKAWKLFEADYAIPNIPANPIQSGFVKDFFDSEQEEYSPQNDGLSLYQSLTSSNLGLAWMDSYGSKVFYIDKADIGQEKLKAKVLFSHSGLKKIELSPDGRFLVFSYMSQASGTSKSCIKVYDISKGHFYSVKEKGLKSPALLMYENDYYLIADKYENHRNQTYLAKLELDSEKNIRGLSPYAIISQQPGVLLSNYKHFAYGQYACIKKQGLSYSLCVFDLEGKLLIEYAMPKERMVIRSLSVDGEKLYFSWATPGTMPRLGDLNVWTGQMDLSEKDLSGGVYQPLSLGDSFVYIGVFLRQNRIFMMKDDGQLLSQSLYLEPMEDSVLVEGLAEDSEVPSVGGEVIASIPESEAFKPYAYWKKGIFIPFSMYETSYFGKNSTYTSNVSQSLLGLTYISSNPWSDGENDLFILTSGWNYLNQALGLEFKAQQGTDTSLLSGAIDVKLEVDKDGFKQIYGQLDNTFVYPFACFSNIGLSNSFIAAYGRQDSKNRNLQLYHELFFWDSSLLGIVAPSDNVKYYTISDAITVKYSNLHRVGSGRFEKAGLSIGISLGYRRDQSIEKNPVTYTEGFILSSSLRVQLPYLIPIKCKGNFVYNLPSRFDMVLFPSSSIYGYTHASTDSGRIILDAKTESILFAFEIQRSIPFFTVLYLNDLYLSAGYAASLGAGNLTRVGFQPAFLPYYIEGISQGKGLLYNSIYAKLCLELTPNLGFFASSSFKLNLFALGSISLNNTNRSRFAWTIGSQANF